MSFVYYPSAQPRRDRPQWLILAMLGVAIFFACHWPIQPQSTLEDYNASQDVIVSDVSGGSMGRELALLAMGAFSIFSLTRPAQSHKFRIDSRMGWLLVAFIAWALMSVLWADDRSLTVKRLVSFAILWLVSVAVVRRFTLRQILGWTFATTAAFVAVAVVVEVGTGAFHPLISGYRFSGIQHPNGAGTECGLLFLCSLASASLDRERRRLYNSVAVIAFLLLILTVSRTAFGATLLSVAVWSIATGSKRLKRRLVAGSLVIAAVVGIFLVSGAYERIQNKLFAGRDEGESSESFAGRTAIWKDVSPFIEQRPMTGFGYGGFWTPLRISIISDEEKWGVPDSHSAYFDYTLALGLVGLALYVLCLLAGLGRAFDLMRRAREAHFAFLAALLVFCIVDGLFESSVVEGSLLTFLAFISLARLGFIPAQALPARIIQGQVSPQRVYAA